MHRTLLPAALSRAAEGRPVERAAAVCLRAFARRPDDGSGLRPRHSSRDAGRVAAPHAGRRVRWTLATIAVAALIVIPRPSIAGAQVAPPPPAAAPTPPPTPAANAYLDAVRKGDVAAVQRALDSGVPVDTPFRYNRTALSFAADRGLTDVVKLLLERGANPDAPDSFYNQTPLGWASQPAQTRKPEHADVVRMLLAKGAKGRERALGAAIGADDVRMAQVILEAGGLPPALLNESLASMKKSGKTEIAAALEKAGATMPVVATLTAVQLARYPGTYNDGRGDVTVTTKDGTLVAATGGGQTLILSPRSETQFAVESIPGLVVTFAIEGDKVTTVTVVNPAGQSTVYKRVNP
jgi:hypothetical protein